MKRIATGESELVESFNREQHVDGKIFLIIFRMYTREVPSVEYLENVHFMEIEVPSLTMEIPFYVSLPLSFSFKLFVISLINIINSIGVTYRR